MSRSDPLTDWSLKVDMHPLAGSGSHVGAVDDPGSSKARGRRGTGGKVRGDKTAYHVIRASFVMPRHLCYWRYGAKRVVVAVFVVLTDKNAVVPA